MFCLTSDETGGAWFVLPFLQLLGLETAKASLLYSMEQGVVQGWVGLDPAEEASVFDRHRSQHEVSFRSVLLEVDADRMGCPVNATRQS